MKISLNIKRIRYRPYGFRCSFCNRFRFKTPGGLTQHQLICSRNPANIYNPPFIPSSQSPSHSPPSQSPSHTLHWQHTPLRTPGLFLQDQHLDFPPHTPAPYNNTMTPTYDSPRRIRWTQKGRVNIRIHPYLDGELFVHPIKVILMHL
jgi:hypothetical protein